MSLGFDTENLFLFREGTRRLTFVDAAHWRSYAFDFAGIGLGLSEVVVREVAELVAASAVSLARDHCLPGGKPGSRTAPQVEALLNQARAIVERVGTLRYVDTAFDITLAPSPLGGMPPLRAAMWMAIGDTPGESFHDEDYEEGWVAPFDPSGLAEYVDLSLACTRMEAEPFLFPVGDERGNAMVSLPHDFAEETRPSALEPLPILAAYVGPGGVGVDGIGCNVADDGVLAPEFRMAVPLACHSGVFITLYLQFGVDDDGQGVLRALQPGAVNALRRTVQEAGFSLEAVHYPPTSDLPRPPSGARCSVWTRGAESDVVHLYEALPGREVLGRDVAPPLLLGVRAEGGFDAARRKALVRSLVGGA